MTSTIPDATLSALKSETTAAATIAAASAKQNTNTKAADINALKTLTASHSKAMAAIVASIVPPAPPAPVVSPDGTTVPPAAAIVDSAGSKWTVIGGQVTQDGVVDAATGSVAVLFYKAGTIFQRNVPWGDWYSKPIDGAAWAAASDPTGTTPTPPAGNGFNLAADPGYKVVFADDYITPVPLGGFRSSGYMATHDMYDDLSHSTDGQGMYADRVVSVSNSCLDYYVRSESGQAYTAAVVPGKYAGFGPDSILECRMRADASLLAPFKQAPLTWANSGKWGDGENDWAECGYGPGARPNWFLHGLGSDQSAAQNIEAVDLGVLIEEWHTYRVVSTPLGISMYVDGKLVKAHTQAWSRVFRHLVLQVETWYDVPPVGVAGHVQFDWIKIQVPAATGIRRLIPRLRRPPVGSQRYHEPALAAA